jgi:hypothetical protein
MNSQHPITPPPELVQQWWEKADQHVDRDDPKTYFDYVATEAARWGADQELEACCKSICNSATNFSAAAHLEVQRKSDDYYALRRPKQPTPKELALLELADVYGRDKIDDVTYDTIRVALEALPE